MARRHKSALAHKARQRLSYAAQNHITPAAEDTDDTYACGGRAKRKKAEQLRAHGGRSKPRADRRPRGGEGVQLVILHGAPKRYAHGGEAEEEMGPVGAVVALAGMLHHAINSHREHRCEEGDEEACDNEE
jgi:hypothetical protein